MTQVNGKVQSTATVVEGKVAAVNEHGLRLQGQGAWLNFSKFSPVQRPEVGQTVRLTVSGGKWVKALEILPETRPETETPTPDRLALRRFALALAGRYTSDPEQALEIATLFYDWLVR